jgi:hypothetical protein
VGWIKGILVGLGAEIVPLVVVYGLFLLFTLAKKDTGVMLLGLWQFYSSIIKLLFLILFVALALGWFSK